ncbi:MliC family protein [Dyella jejuensis]|uniref:MliC family protein n=1 Tax=Dyella jejuensis TaxID=1432009 RepID=A0ABW8JMB2_9GAMM
MHSRNLLLASIATLALTGCVAPAARHADRGLPISWTDYRCSDGQTVQAAYPDADTALIKVHGEAHTLHVALSGSGARYTGDGWQWWTKGMHDGMLAPLASGETIASSPSIDCQAR